MILNEALPVKSDTGRKNHIWERKKDLKKYFYLQRGGTQVFANKRFASVQGASSSAQMHLPK